MKWKFSLFNFFVFLQKQVLIKNYLSGSVIKISKRSFTNLTEIIERNHEMPNWARNLASSNMILVKEDIDEISVFRNMLQDSFNESGKKLMIYFLPTLLCQFNCYYCFEKQKYAFTKTMTKETENLFIKWLIKYLNLNPEISEVRIIFFGGEPLVRKDVIMRVLDETKRITSSLGITISTELITNGELIDEKIMEVFKKYSLKRLQITLDGYKKYHNKIRFSTKGGSFDNIISNILYVVKNDLISKIDLRINLSEDNYISVKKLIQYINKIGLSPRISLTIGIVEDYGNSCGGCNKQDIEKITAGRYLRLILLAQELGFEVQSEFSAGPICFAKIKHSVVIKPNGAMQKCFCSVANESYDFSTLNNEESNINLFDFRYSLDINRIGKCISERCPFIPICNGGCTWRSVFKNPENGHLSRTCNKDAMEIINAGLIRANIY